MTSLEYWKERERAAAEEYAVQDEEALRRTQDVYLRLMASINDRINAFYARYAASEGITMNLAEMAVSQFDVKAFEATAAKMVADKDFSPQANAQLKIYNATMRINRLEMLKAYIGLDTIAAGEELVQLDESYLTERCREEFERQAGILGESIRPTRKEVDAIVHSSFYNATFSQRIWANMSELHDELSTILTNGIIQGINPREMTSRLTERFQVSESDAERLLRTEMARVQTETQRQSFQMAGFEYYVFISLEGRACPVCAALDTGEPIPLEDFMPGETAPPVHPNCRCSVAAWMDREQMEKELGFALDEEEDEALTEQIALLNKYRTVTNMMLTGSAEDLTRWQTLSGQTGLNEAAVRARMFDNPKYWESVLSTQNEAQMKTLSNKLLETATDSELSALRMWTGETFSSINQYARYGTAVDDLSMTAAKGIESVLGKVTIDQPMILKRGTGIRHIFADMPEGWRDNLTLLTGKTFSDDGFTATSPMSSGGFGGSGTNRATMYIKAPAGTHGAYISDVSKASLEKEFLLQKGYSYRIMQAEYKPNPMYPDEKDLTVWVEVITE